MVSNLRVLVFLTISGSLLVGIHVYLYRRAVAEVFAKPWLRRLGKTAFWTLGVAAILGRPTLYIFGGRGTRSLAVVVLTWLGFALAWFLLLASLRGAMQLGFWVHRRRRPEAPPVSEERRRFLSRALVGTSAVVAGTASGWGMYRGLGPAQVTEVAVKLPRLPAALSGLTLVQLSDVHIGEISQERFLREVVERCNGLQPDAVVITGDLVDGSVPRLGGFVSQLSNLRSRYGTFFVTGNHDYYSGADAWCAALERMGITVLRNRFVPLGDAGPQGASIDLVGVDDWGERRTGRGYDLDAALKARDGERAAVLLAHQPSNFAEAVRGGIGLQLSGHTHGGQAFPLTRLVGVAWPYSAGLYTRDGSHIYVSRGTGFVGPPMRIDSPPEIVRLTLTA